MPGAIEHEDGVIDNAVDQYAKTPLAFPQRFLAGAALRHVACDLGKSDELTMLIAHSL